MKSDLVIQLLSNLGTLTLGYLAHLLQTRKQNKDFISQQIIDFKEISNVWRTSLDELKEEYKQLKNEYNIVKEQNNLLHKENLQLNLKISSLENRLKYTEKVLQDYNSNKV